MTVYEFIVKYVTNENEIHFYDKNAKSIGMIPSNKLVGEWIDEPIICEDTFKARPMPEHIIQKICNGEFVCISAGGTSFLVLNIYVNIDAKDIFVQ